MRKADVWKKSINDINIICLRQVRNEQFKNKCIINYQYLQLNHMGPAAFITIPAVEYALAVGGTTVLAGVSTFRFVNQKKKNLENQQTISELNKNLRLTMTSLKENQIQTSKIHKELSEEKQQRIKQAAQHAKLLTQMTQKYRVAIQNLKKEKNCHPRQIKENIQKIFCDFLNCLKPYEIYNPLPKEGDVKYVAVIGQTSAGKSSIYNNIFGLHLKTGQNEVTDTIQIVRKDEERNRVYWDSPGLNDTVELIEPTMLQAFYHIDYVFIVTGITFKFCSKAIQILEKIKPPSLRLVRTQCDKFKTDVQFDEVMDQDRTFLESIGVKSQVLYISSVEPEEFRDNREFKRIFTGQE